MVFAGRAGTLTAHLPQQGQAHAEKSLMRKPCQVALMRGSLLTARSLSATATAKTIARSTLRYRTCVSVHVAFVTAAMATRVAPPVRPLLQMPQLDCQHRHRPLHQPPRRQRHHRPRRPLRCPPPAARRRLCQPSPHRRRHQRPRRRVPVVSTTAAAAATGCRTIRAAPSHLPPPARPQPTPIKARAGTALVRQTAAPPPAFCLWS